MSEMPPNLDRFSTVHPRRLSTRVTVALRRSALHSRPARLGKERKGRTHPSDYQKPTPQPDEPWDAESSAHATQRGAKRRRLTSPSLSIQTELIAVSEWADDDNEKTAVDEDFHMFELEGPQGPPRIPTEPNSN